MQDKNMQLSKADSFQGFQNATGEPATPQPISFRTRAAGQQVEPAQPLTADENRKAIEAWRASFALLRRLRSRAGDAFFHHATSRFREIRVILGRLLLVGPAESDL